MTPMLRGLLVSVVMLPLFAAAAELPSRRFGLPIDPGGNALVTPPLDAEKALAEDAVADKGAPLRYAIRHKAGIDVSDRSKSAIGQWTDVDAEFELWRARIHAPGAVSIDLALAPFHLPEGAEVWLSDSSGTRLRGPYTAADNPASGEFWTPYVPGDVAYLEVLVPKARRHELRLGVMSVQQAYREIETGRSPFAKSGSCNVDVICPEGDGYRDQINAVARYTVAGGLCTGQLINNTAQDNKRYFITANHCVSSQSEADSVVLYWKYESPTCRTPGSSASGTPISVSGNSIVQTGGAALRATYEPADTTLLELNTAVPTAANPFWLGWDRSNTVPTAGIAIHHPNGDEKRISFENDPLVSSDTPPAGVPGSHHWHVQAWDLGTTEPGSSGSVLLNPQKRLIGVLSGGAASCSFNFDDYFGRLNVAWEGGGTASSRVKDWLDPGNTGAMTLDGKAACNQPTVALSLATSSPVIDQDVVLQATVSGGAGPYTLDWDVDGDGLTDRRSSGVGAGNIQLPVRYPTRGNVTVRLTVTDASNCAAGPVTLSFAVRGPQLTATPIGTATQSCGDGDANVEPGEIWDVPVRVSNTGDDSTNDGYAVFSGGTAPGLGSGNSLSDAFGYRALSSTSSTQCGFQPIDMSNVAPLTLTRGPHVSSTISPNDEGYVAGLPVGNGTGFQFYGTTIQTLLMSTNGYLSTNPADGGDDYLAVCGVDDHEGVIDGRIQVLHDDLVVQSGGSLKHRHFTSCPRPADAGSPSQGCTVFEWRNLGRFVNSGSPNGNAVFQAVLYDQSYEIVYQYITADPNNGGTASIGLQSPDQSVRFDYRCDSANAAPAGTAICFFHPSSLPAALAEANVHIVSGAASLGDLAANGQRDLTIKAYVDPAAVCGSRAVVSYLGGVDDHGFSFVPTKVLDVAMPASGNCQVSTQCGSQIQGFGAPPAGGVYFNAARPGNGQNIFSVGNVLSAAWFTGNADRSATWYLNVGPWDPAFAQAKTEIKRFTQVGSTPFTVAASVEGTAWYSRGDDDASFVNAWILNGVWGGEKQTRVYSTSDLPTPNHTGGWANTSESGWGLVIDEHRINGQPATGMLAYFYDERGEPRWSIAESDNTSTTQSHLAASVHCPSCPSFPSLPLEVQGIGTVTRNYQSQTSGTFDVNLTWPGNQTGHWLRTAFPMQMITPPLSPSP